MNEHKLKNEAVHYERLKQRLLDEYPDLVEDEEALADTLEGATDLHSLVAAVCRSAQEDKVSEKALGDYIGTLQKRKARLATRAATKKNLVLSVLSDCGLAKVSAPDLTASVRRIAPSPTVADPDSLPDEFVRIERKPMLSEIRDAWKAGAEIPGVQLDNGSQSLTIRNS